MAKRDFISKQLWQQHKNTRVFYSYFRVVFHGKMFKDNEDLGYIYRFSQRENLMTIQHHLKTVIIKSHNVAEDDIEVLGNEEVKQDALEAGKAYIQIAALTPFVEGELNSALFESHFSISTYFYFVVWPSGFY